MKLFQVFIILHPIVGILSIIPPPPIECARCDFTDLNCRDTDVTVAEWSGKWGHRGLKDDSKMQNEMQPYFGSYCKNPQNRWCVKIKVFTGIDRIKDQRVRRDCCDKLPPGIRSDTCVYTKQVLNGEEHPALFCSCRNWHYCNSLPRLKPTAIAVLLTTNFLIKSFIH